ncbi:hypothetical protein [Gephyromycinifex aptenodytis]|uniref:hypothetical protein n=1 Tax=Gephyromycinifex aptenodytis TaxID=2716227 RepID=UPI00144878B8|nr:hypothetical protein [Gephyromycinifex aptenodytis]
MDTPWWHRPTDRWTRAGDVLRLLGLCSAICAPLRFGWVATPLFALVVLGLALLRLRDVPSSADPAGGAVLLAAGWFAILDLYARVPGLDLAVHFAAGGVVAHLALTIARTAGVVRGYPQPSRAALALLGVSIALGLALGYVWELLEWAGHTWVDPRIHIPYADTMTDIAAGGLGAAAMGIVRLWVGERESK